jgi:glucokinase
VPLIARDDDDGHTILGIDIGGTKTALMATTRTTGRCLAKASLDTPHDAAPGAFIALLRREADAMLAGAGIKPGSVTAVGCAVPGQVDGEGLVIGAGNLEGWGQVPLRTLLEREWRAPAFVDQDANAGALGEMWRGAAQAMSDFVFIALGTGVGAGIVLGRRIHRGAHHAAGELGDLVPDRDALGRGPRDAHNLASRLGSRALRSRARRMTGDDMRAADVVSNAAHDRRLAAVARDMAADVAIAVIAISALLDPEAIVFGGGTAAAGEDLLAQVRDRVKHELWIEPVLVLAALGEAAQLYGVVAGAMAKLDPNFVMATAGRPPA